MDIFGHSQERFPMSNYKLIPVVSFFQVCTSSTNPILISAQDLSKNLTLRKRGSREVCVSSQEVWDAVIMRLSGSLQTEELEGNQGRGRTKSRSKLNVY